MSAPDASVLHHCSALLGMLGYPVSPDLVEQLAFYVMEEPTATVPQIREAVDEYLSRDESCTRCGVLVTRAPDDLGWYDVGCSTSCEGTITLHNP